MIRETKMIIKKTVNIIFDNRCILCGNKVYDGKNDYICKPCFDSFELDDIDKCRICGHPLEKNQCPSCIHIEEKYFDSFSFIQYYRGIFRDLVRIWKKEENFKVNHLFFSLIRKNNLIPESATVTIIPDHFLDKYKKGKRGLAYLLKLFKKNNYCTYENIFRKKYFSGKKQKKKSMSERYKEIEDVFYLPGNIKNKYSGEIYLIDDIYTTGATINRGAQLLKEAGFSKVHIVTFFRSVLTEY